MVRYIATTQSTYMDQTALSSVQKATKWIRYQHRSHTN